MRERIPYLDALRCMAICLVVFGLNLYHQLPLFTRDGVLYNLRADAWGPYQGEADIPTESVFALLDSLQPAAGLPPGPARPGSLPNSEYVR